MIAKQGVILGAALALGACGSGGSGTTASSTGSLFGSLNGGGNGNGATNGSGTNGASNAGASSGSLGSTAHGGAGTNGTLAGIGATATGGTSGTIAGTGFGATSTSSGGTTLQTNGPTGTTGTTGNVGFTPNVEAAGPGLTSDGGADVSELEVLLADATGIVPSGCAQLIADEHMISYSLAVGVVVYNPTGSVPTGTFPASDTIGFHPDGGFSLTPTALVALVGPDGGEQAFSASGTVTLDEVDTTTVSGSFDVQLKAERTGAALGEMAQSFSAPYCSQL